MCAVFSGYMEEPELVLALVKNTMVNNLIFGKIGGLLELSNTRWK